jgi:pimeloyl-ACP methyl ester carboxylesterase
MSPTETFEQTLQAFPLQSVGTPAGAVAYRHAGGMPASQATHVLLHGIGSGSASWVAQLLATSQRPDRSVLAWEAPGYGASAPLAAEHPLALDYALRMWAWLDAVGVSGPITLVGHSLGALMAASATRMSPHRVARLVLLSPARGYGSAPEAERDKKLADRLTTLHTLGPQGMAQKRGAAMLSPHASATQIAFIQTVMGQLQPAGYTQAAQMLSRGDLAADIAHLACPISVGSGRADTVTPMAACQAVAEQARVAWTDLGEVGHACPLEAATAVNALLDITPQ